MQKALIYVRKSTDRQQYTLEGQEEQCRLYCRLKELEVVGVVSDSAISGWKPLAKRPAGKVLLARAGEVDAIVSLKLDRMFRDVQDCIANVRAWQLAGKVVHFLDVGIDTSSPTGELLLNLMAAIAQWERRRIGERTKESLAVAKSQGKRIGVAPLGFRNAVRFGKDGRKIDAGLHVPDPRELGALQRIQELAGGGLSARGIARQLIVEKVPSRHGGTWTHVQVAKVLRRAA